MNREELEQAYFDLGNELPKIHNDLNFDNHCYWRIALDQTIGQPWKEQIKSPAYKNLDDQQLQNVIKLLKNYKSDRDLLKQHNQDSLRYRGKN